MERTESVIIQVAPSFENDKIREMATFGWNLQGRQEIHEEGDAYGRPSYVSSNTYVIKTQVSKYVKLHFVRSLGLPNLEHIRALEAEYNALPFPQSKSIVWPILFMLMPIPGGLVMLADPLGKQGSPGLLGLIVVVPWLFLGLRWVRSRRAKNAAALDERAASAKRSAEIMREVTALAV